MQWVVPEQGQALTDIAAHYVWEAVPGARSYVLEWAQSAEFQNAVSVAVEQVPGCGVAFYLPDEGHLPPAGPLFLRVASDNGVQSSVLQISVNKEHPQSPLRWDFSPEKPYFMILDYSEHNYGEVYQMLPDVLQGCSAIGVSTSYRVPSAELLASLMRIDREEIPWHLGAAGPHLTVGALYTVTPLSTVEYLLQHAHNLKSVGLVEQYLGTKAENDWRVSYFKRLVMLCAKYGVPFLYADGNRNALEMASFVKRPLYMDFLRRYAPYCTLSFKQNHSHAAYTCYGAILGAWIDGACAHIGVQPENWYWNDAGFRKETGVCHGYLQGIEQQMPACMAAEMMLTGLSIGACCYSMEGEGWLIQARGSSRLEFSPAGIAAVSLMQTIAVNRLVPNKKTVTAEIRAAVQADGWGEALGDAWTGGVYRGVFEKLFGVHSGFELFPRQSRFYYLPLVTDRPKSFAGVRVIDAESAADSGEMVQRLADLYPRRFSGDAYLTDAGNRYVVMNSNENCAQSQSFMVRPVSVDGSPALVSSLEGSLGLWQYVVFWQRNGVLHLHLNAPARTALKLRLHREKPLAFSTAGAGVEVRWDEVEKCAEVSLSGSGEPAELTFVEPGTPPPAPVEPVRNEPDRTMYLSDLPFADVHAGGRWLPARNRCADGAFGVLPLSMNSLRYPKGLSFTPCSEVSYELSGAYRSLTMTCGFDIDAWMPVILDREHIVWDRRPRKISLCFTVFGDGEALYRSPVLTCTDWRQTVTVKLSGVRNLTFRLEGEVVSDAPDSAAFLDIGNPQLLPEEAGNSTAR